MDLKDNLEQTRIMLEEQTAEKFRGMVQHNDIVEKNLNLGIEKNQKETERLKYDLIDILENKHQILLGKFNTELKTLKEKYEESTKNVKAAGNELGSMFVDKAEKIKLSCSNYFARAEQKIDECNRDTIAVGNLIKGI